MSTTKHKNTNFKRDVAAAQDTTHDKGFDKKVVNKVRLARTKRAVKKRTQGHIEHPRRR